MTYTKLKEYKIVGNENCEHLVLMVNELIDLGWEPVGGVCKGSFQFYQAMIRKETEYVHTGPK